MKCGKCEAARIPVLSLFILLIASFPQLELVFKLINAQTNQTDVLARDSSNTRTVLRNPEKQSSTFAKLISVATDRQHYRPNEIVNITITNIGTQPIYFSGATSDIKIRNLKTNETFIPSIVLLSSLIPSGASKVFSWSQQDFGGQQVQLGNYSAQVTIGELSSKSAFSIS